MHKLLKSSVRFSSQNGHPIGSNYMNLRYFPSVVGHAKQIYLGQVLSIQCRSRNSSSSKKAKIKRDIKKLRREFINSPPNPPREDNMEISSNHILGRMISESKIEEAIDVCEKMLTKDGARPSVFVLNHLLLEMKRQSLAEKKNLEPYNSQVNNCLKLYDTINSSGIMKYDQVHYELTLQIICITISHILKLNSTIKSPFQEPNQKTSNSIPTYANDDNDQSKKYGSSSSDIEIHREETMSNEISTEQMMKQNYHLSEYLVKRMNEILNDCLDDGFIPKESISSIIRSLCSTRHEDEAQKLIIDLKDKIRISDYEPGTFTQLFKSYFASKRFGEAINFYLLLNQESAKEPLEEEEVYQCLLSSCLYTNNLDSFSQISKRLQQLEAYPEKKLVEMITRAMLSNGMVIDITHLAIEILEGTDESKKELLSQEFLQKLSGLLFKRREFTLLDKLRKFKQ